MVESETRPLYFGNLARLMELIGSSAAPTSIYKTGAIVDQALAQLSLEISHSQNSPEFIFRVINELMHPELIGTDARLAFVIHFSAPNENARNKLYEGIRLYGNSHINRAIDSIQSGEFDTVFEYLRNPEHVDRYVVFWDMELSSQYVFQALETTIGPVPQLISNAELPTLVLATKEMLESGTPQIRSTLLDVMKKGKRYRTIFYANQKIELTNPEIFGPAIDTLFFMRELMLFMGEAGLELIDELNHVIEIGTGSGVLALIVLEMMSKYRPNLKGFTLTVGDINPVALEFAKSLLQEKASPLGAEIAAILSSNMVKELKDDHSQPAQLIISNPPYVPVELIIRLLKKHTVRELTPAMIEQRYHTYALASVVSNTSEVPSSLTDSLRAATSGVELYRQALLENGPDLLDEDGLVILLTSSTSEIITSTFFRASPFEARLLATLENVPFDLPNLTADPRVQAILNKLPGITFDPNDATYPYTHDLKIWVLFRPGSHWDAKINGIDKDSD